jgi:hypothetical protein
VAIPGPDDQHLSGVHDHAVGHRCRAMKKETWSREKAQDYFKKKKPHYHSVSQRLAAKDKKRIVSKKKAGRL